MCPRPRARTQGRHTVPPTPECFVACNISQHALQAPCRQLGGCLRESVCEAGVRRQGNGSKARALPWTDRGAGAGLRRRATMNESFGGTLIPSPVMAGLVADIPPLLTGSAAKGG